MNDGGVVRRLRHQQRSLVIMPLSSTGRADFNDESGRLAALGVALQPADLLR
jgi:hypothetical protein